MKDLAQVAWNFINDSLRTTIALHVHSRPQPPRRAAHSPSACRLAYRLASRPAPRPAACHRQHLPPAQYTPQCVAASAVYLASRFLGVTIPTRYEAIDVLQAEVEAVAEQILAYYPDGEDPIERQQRRRQCVRRRLRHGCTAMHGAYLYTAQHTAVSGIHIVTGTCVPRRVVRCRPRRRKHARACSTSSCSSSCGAGASPRTVYYYFARRPARRGRARGGRALARPEATKAARRLERRAVSTVS